MRVAAIVATTTRWGSASSVEGIVMKLRTTIVVEWKVRSLDDYDTESIEEAAALTQKQLDDGDIGAEDVISWGEVIAVKVEAV